MTAQTRVVWRYVDGTGRMRYRNEDIRTDNPPFRPTFERREGGRLEAWDWEQEAWRLTGYYRKRMFCEEEWVVEDRYDEEA